jgi:hypothetical protein
MKVHNCFGPNIVTASANTVATAATIANYPLLLYIPCPQDLLPLYVSTSAQQEGRTERRENPG